MTILGIESSCDECAVAVVADGRRLIGQVVATQIEYHRPYSGVVPEIASRKHTEWIESVYRGCLDESGIDQKDLDGIAVSCRPGLVGSLLVGVSFAKALAYALDLPLIGVDHIIAHLYAPHLEHHIEYPFLGVLLSGGHTLIARVGGYDDVEVVGATIDDAVGEAFDKVAGYFELGYPGGVEIDKHARRGDARAYRFPAPRLHKGDHPFDLSYSGLKTAVVNQREQFRDSAYEATIENICASFEKAAIDMLVSRVLKAAEHFGLNTVVAGGGVAANTYFREALTQHTGLQVVLPSLALCTDNGAMVAALGYEYLSRGLTSGLDLDVSARTPGYRRTYP